MADARSRRIATCVAICIPMLMDAMANCGVQAQDTPQNSPSESSQVATPENAKSPKAPAVVEVQPSVRDEEIVNRLEKILKATGWFESPKVHVDEGVVFLHGRTDDEQYKTWATDLARNTRDVVAVVNQIEVARPSPWNFAPALAGVRDLGRSVIVWMPYAVLALVIFLITSGVAILVTRGLHSLLVPRIRVPLLQKVVSRSAGILVFLFGLYIVLKICGLTRLALTVVGGTGLVGLVIGIAFRDITENFLASILLSVQSPFRTGDLVELAGVLGFVQQLNVRTTVLMSLSGQLIQLPNSVVYKSTIRNYSSNPNRREEITIGIGYKVPINRAQEIAMTVLEEHPAVLKSPEPWVLVDSLGAATVNLRIYFWLDGSQFSWLKVKSSVTRLVKRAFQDHDITIPDAAREVIFPRGVPVRMIPESKSARQGDGQMRGPAPGRLPTEGVSVDAEGGLDSDDRQIKAQGNQARASDEGENLLQSND